MSEDQGWLDEEKPTARPLLPLQKEIELGRAIARMYIAAQGVSLQASDKACEAMDDQSRWVKWGFNAEIRTSPYNVRA